MVVACRRWDTKRVEADCEERERGEGGRRRRRRMVVVEGATIMSGAREGEQDKNGVRGRGGGSGREKKEVEEEAEAG